MTEQLQNRLAALCFVIIRELQTLVTSGKLEPEAALINAATVSRRIDRGAFPRIALPACLAWSVSPTVAAVPPAADDPPRCLAAGWGPAAAQSSSAQGVHGAERGTGLAVQGSQRRQHASDFSPHLSGQGHVRGKMITRNVYSELVFDLSPSKHVRYATGAFVQPPLPAPRRKEDSYCKKLGVKESPVASLFAPATDIGVSQAIRDWGGAFSSSRSGLAQLLTANVLR